MSAPTFNDLVNAITGEHTPRVWSLLVTVFGELAQDEGAAITGALLRTIADRVGFKPEALRVALFRLRRDGWINSQRSGRTSSYSLTSKGRASSADATPRIYAAQSTAQTCWLVLCDPKSVAAPKAGSQDAWIGPSSFLTAQRPEAETALCLQIHNDTPLPRWIDEKLCETDVMQKSEILMTDLKRFGDLLQKRPVPTPLDIAVLRVLIVHEWRRVILRAPVLPDYICPKGTQLTQCRAVVAEHLAALPRQSLDILQDKDANR